MLDETIIETRSLPKEEMPLPDSWRRIKLSECLTLYNGRAYSQHEMLNEGTPIVRIQNLNGGDKWFYSNLQLPTHQYCDSGDLLYAWSASFGVYIWNGQKAIFHYHIWKVVPRDNLDKGFAFYLLQEITDELKLSSHGLAMLHITKSGMENWFVNLPPIEEQRRIASILDEQMKAVEQARLAIDAQLATASLLPHAFLSSIFESEEAQNWQKKKLGDVCEITRGKFSHRPRNAPQFYGGDVPFIQTGDVVKANGGSVGFTQTLNDLGLSVSKLFEPTIVLITIAANIGDTAILDYAACFPDSVVGLIPRNGTNPYFLEFIMRTKKEALNQFAPQAAQKNINIQILNAIDLSIPPIDEQRKLAERLNEQMQAVGTLKASLTEKLAAVKNLPAALLRKAFAGEL